MEDQDTKDFNRGLHFFCEKYPLFTDLKKSEAIRELLFNDFLKTEKLPDLYLFQASIFKNEFEHHRFLRSKEDGNSENPFNQMLDAIFNTWIEHQQNNTLDSKFYAHFIEDCPTWKIIKEIIGAYDRAIENLIRADYKEELRTADSFTKALDRNLNRIDSNIVKKDILKIFYQKEYTMYEYQHLNKFCNPEGLTETEEANRRFNTFSQELDNYIYDILNDLSIEEMEVKYTKIADIWEHAGKTPKIKPSIIKHIIENKNVLNESDKIIWLKNVSDLIRDMLILWKIEIKDLKPKMLNNCFITYNEDGTPRKIESNHKTGVLPYYKTDNPFAEIA